MPWTHSVSSKCGFDETDDRIDVDYAQATSTEDRDPPFAVPFRDLRAPRSPNVGCVAVHATAAKGDIARIARQRMVAPVPWQSPFQREDCTFILAPDPKFLQA